jgi:hypothetical protein
MSLRIRFNSQEYPSLEAMPADVRAMYEQQLETLSPSMRAFYEKGIARAADPSAGEVVLTMDQPGASAIPSDRPWRGIATLVLFMLLAGALVLLLGPLHLGRP